MFVAAAGLELPFSVQWRVIPVIETQPESLFVRPDDELTSLSLSAATPFEIRDVTSSGPAIEIVLEGGKLRHDSIDCRSGWEYCRDPKMDAGIQGTRLYPVG